VSAWYPIERALRRNPGAAREALGAGCALLEDLIAEASLPSCQGDQPDRVKAPPGPSLPSLIMVIGRGGFGDHQDSPRAEKRGRAFDHDGWGPEGSRHDQREDAPQVGAPTRGLGSLPNHPNPPRPAQVGDRAHKELSPPGIAVEEDGLPIRPAMGQHQPGDASARAEVQPGTRSAGQLSDCGSFIRRGNRGGGKALRVGDMRLEGSVSEEASIPGLPQDRDQRRGQGGFRGFCQSSASSSPVAGATTT
jgi:hypothetical protein